MQTVCEEALWARLVCEEGQDDCLPYLKDWMLERGLPVWPIDDYLSRFNPRNDNPSFTEGFSNPTFIVKDIRATLSGRSHDPAAARVIRDWRMGFRRWVARKLGVKVNVTSRSEPRWIPTKVQRFLSDQFYARGFANIVLHQLGSLPWRFLGELKSGIFCYHEHQSDWVEACGREQCQNDEAWHKEQTWWARFCPECGVLWSTDGRELEDDSRYYTGIK